MTPSASSAARRPSPRTAPVRASSDRARPPLRVFEPASRSRRRIRQRPTMVLSGAIVVASLLSIVVADGLLAQGQIRLSATHGRIAAENLRRQQLQIEVNTLAAPQRIVSVAEGRLGMVTPGQVVDLPAVPLNVALPAPDTSPLAPIAVRATVTGSAAGPRSAATVPATTNTKTPVTATMSVPAAAAVPATSPKHP
jgi:hypothetical protein